MLFVLRKRKANSVCGDRDPCYVRKIKQKVGLDQANILFAGSQRAMSLYSERQHVGSTDHPKKFDWRYRVKNRDTIPDFFPSNLDNLDVVKDPKMRYSTPEKMTYHLPKEEQSHDYEITFLDELVKDKKSVQKSILSAQEKETLLEMHELRKIDDFSIDEDLLFGTDSDDSFTKDYNIPKETLRKEGIIKRDKSRFQKEK